MRLCEIETSSLKTSGLGRKRSLDTIQAWLGKHLLNIKLKPWKRTNLISYVNHQNNVYVSNSTYLCSDLSSAGLIKVEQGVFSLVLLQKFYQADDEFRSDIKKRLVLHPIASEAVE